MKRFRVCLEESGIIYNVVPVFVHHRRPDWQKFMSCKNTRKPIRKRVTKFNKNPVKLTMATCAFS